MLRTTLENSLKGSIAVFSKRELFPGAGYFHEKYVWIAEKCSGRLLWVNDEELLAKEQ